MNEGMVGEFLLLLAFFFAASLILGLFLERFKIPAILGALFVGILFANSHFAKILQSTFKVPFDFLANLGVLFLLFFIGSELDIKQMQKQSKAIIQATFLNTIFPFIFGFLVMQLFGYGLVISFIVGLALMPTAEAVVVPILDEFNLIKSKVGSFVVGAGVLDDVIEVFLVSFVSIIIGMKLSKEAFHSQELLEIALHLFLFIALAWLLVKILPKIAQLLSKKALWFLVTLLFFLGGVASKAHLGLIIGAITAGVIFAHIIKKEKILENVKDFAYGFFGILFFLWIGLSVNIEGIFKAPLLTLAIFMAAFFGKIVGILLLVPLKKLTLKEAILIGVGLNARLTTEIIVAKLLLDANLIDTKLFSAFVAFASISTVLVSIVFTILLKLWHSELKGVSYEH